MAATLDRRSAPPFSRSISFELIPPRTVTLPNGIRMFTVQGGTQAVAKVELVVNAGRWHESRWSAAYFCSHTLSKGTSSKTSFEIAQTFDHYGAHLEISPGMDVVYVTLYTLSKNLEPTLDLLREVLQDAIFPERELQQLKDIYLQNLVVNYEKTSFQASVLFRKSLFGENHPYGKEPTADDVQAISRDVIASHYTAFGHDITAFVSGDIDAAREDMVARVLNSLTYAPVRDRHIAPAATVATREHVPKEGSVQSSVRVGKKFIGRAHPDYAPALLLNHILGGYFGSRLMRNLREDKGLTYGIHASLNTLLRESQLVISTDVNNDKVEFALDEIRQELKRLRTTPVDAEELDIARNHFIGGLQSELTTPFAHADKFKNIYLHKLPASFYSDLLLNVDAVTPEGLLRVGEQYFSEDSFTEISVG